jgi:hypothetical protein
MKAIAANKVATTLPQDVPNSPNYYRLMTFVLESSAEPTTSAADNLSPEKQKAIASQVETALYNSEVFQNTRSALQKLPERKRKAIENAIRVNCRQAIHLAIREILQQNSEHVVEQQDPLSSNEAETATAEFSDDNDNSDSDHSDELDVDFVPSPYFSQTPDSSSKDDRNGNQWQQLSKFAGRVFGKKASASANGTSKTNNSPDSPPTFEQRLQQIGQTLQKARKARSLSLQQLHHHTFIPIYQLQALESGQLDSLPEDIYIRGFISRISNALNIDGNALLDSLPQSPNSVIPSWHGKVSSRDISVNAPSMYLGYAAVFATALGSVVWLADNTQASSPSVDSQAENPSQPESETNQSSDSVFTVQHRSPQQVGKNMAPPEWSSGYESVKIGGHGR